MKVKIALLLSIVVYQSAIYHPAFASTTVRFASMNLHCQFDDWKWRLSKIASGLAAAQPAVVFFQEVCDGQGTSMTSEIPTLLKNAGYAVKSSRALFAHDAWDGKYKEYLLVATLYPHAEWIGGSLPGDGLKRVFLGLNVQNTTFIDIHLTNDPETNRMSASDPAEQSPQESRTAQIRYLTQQFASDPNASVLFMGDFNSSPNEPEQKAFLEKSCVGFFPGPTEPLPKPKWAIDGAWMTQGFAKVLRTAQIKKIFDQPVEGHYLSDHAGVLLTVQLN